MNTTIQMGRYQWIKPLIQKKLTYSEVLKTCPHSKRSLERWMAAYKKNGIDGLAPMSTEPKTQKKETSIDRTKRKSYCPKKTDGTLRIKTALETRKTRNTYS